MRVLSIIVPEIELFNEETSEFTTIKETPLELEHSLISISKWESYWEKPFLKTENKTTQQTIDYIRLMTITKKVNPIIYDNLTDEFLTMVNKYINAPMTATIFSEDKNQKSNREVVTSEIIYYRMIALNIPMECEKWHLNRLLTLIRVCNIKSQPPKKRGRKEMIDERNALNAARLNELNTKG